MTTGRARAVGGVGRAEERVVRGEPVVHRAPVERDVARQEGHRPAPGGIRRGPPAGTHGQEPRRPLQLRLLRLVGGLEEVGPHVALRKVVDGQPARLVQELHPPGVGDRLLAKKRADPARVVLEEEDPLGRFDRDVEAACRPLPERSAADGERHHTGPYPSATIADSATEEAAMAPDKLTITDNRTGRIYEVAIEDGAIRASELRQIKVDEDDFGLLSYDPAFLNTASTRSAITYIDGDKGILRYRGYPIEVLAERCTFLEVTYLLLFGELPTEKELSAWVYNITHHTMLHETTKKFME